MRNEYLYDNVEARLAIRWVEAEPATPLPAVDLTLGTEVLENGDLMPQALGVLTAVCQTALGLFFGHRPRVAEVRISLGVHRVWDEGSSTVESNNSLVESVNLDTSDLPMNPLNLACARLLERLRPLTTPTN